MDDVSASPVARPLEADGGPRPGDRLFAMLQRALPQQALSSLMHRLARTRIVPVKNTLIRWFSKRYRVDMASAEQTDPYAYDHFNAFSPAHCVTEHAHSKRHPMPFSLRWTAE